MVRKNREKEVAAFVVSLHHLQPRNRSWNTKSSQALGASRRTEKCLLTTEGSRKNTFPCLGAEPPVWQGARTAHTPRMERTSNAARRDGSTPKQGKVFLREPYGDHDFLYFTMHPNILHSCFAPNCRF